MSTDTSSKKFFTMPLEKSEFNNWIKPSKTLSPVIKKPKGLRFQFKKNSSKFWIIETKKISYGQIYVALKRVTLLGLHVLGFFSVKAIWTEPQKLAQHNKMCWESGLVVIGIEDLQSNSLGKPLLSMRSLNKHAVGLACDGRVLNSKMTCVTKIQFPSLPNP